MKGIIFTEFLELVEDKFGLETVDEIITASELSNGGAYTAIGTYNFAEMLSLLTHLSDRTKLSVNQLLLTYGEHFFAILRKSYPQLIERYEEPIALLSSIENHIHVEVRKIYPDAELPTFEILEKTENHLEMVYKSSRAMSSFGLGLMNKTFEHYNAKANIQLVKKDEKGTEVIFRITKIHATN